MPRRMAEREPNPRRRDRNLTDTLAPIIRDNANNAELRGGHRRRPGPAPDHLFAGGTDWDNLDLGDLQRKLLEFTFVTVSAMLSKGGTRCSGSHATS